MCKVYRQIVTLEIVSNVKIDQSVASKNGQTTESIAMVNCAKCVKYLDESEGYENIDYNVFS